MSDTLQTCNSTFCDTIIITNAPPPPCNASFGYSVDTAQTSGVYFYDQSTYQPVNWFWDFGDGNYDSTGNSNPTHFYAVQDTYVVCLTIINIAGDTCSVCDTINTIPCTQFLNTSFTFSISNDTAFFTNNSSGSSNPSYNWNFGDGNYSNAQNPVHAYIYNGTYIACLSYGDTFCMEYVCDTVIITNGSPAPCIAQFTYYVYADTALFPPYDTIVQFIDQSTLNPVQWFWDFGDGNFSSQQNPIHQYTVSDTYYVCLTIVNQSGDSCTNCDSVAAKLRNTGIYESAENIISLKNYPNPFNSSTTISYSLKEKSEATVSVYNHIGMKVAELENSNREAGNHQLKWNAENLNAGVYFLEIKSGGSVLSRKMVLIK